MNLYTYFRAQEEADRRLERAIFYLGSGTTSFTRKEVDKLIHQHGRIRAGFIRRMERLEKEKRAA